MSYCSYCINSNLDKDYHDNERGRPIFDDQKLFEFLCLESLQCGLCWITILKKRMDFCRVFDNFNYFLIAAYDKNKVNEILKDKNIIHSINKINGIINNAKCFMKVKEEFGSFSNYLWNFTDHKVLIYKNKEVVSKNDLSTLISKDLKNRGFKYVGPTIIYSYLEACGLINNHDESCFAYQEIVRKYEFKIIE